MKNIIAFSILALLLGAGVGHADVAPGMQQGEVSLFEQMDQNSDGIVSQSEFDQYRMGKNEKIQLFTVIDKNGDGTISVTEWQSYQVQPRAAEEPAMEQPMSPEEKSIEEDQSRSERAYGPGVENQQRRLLDEKLARQPEQQ